MEFYATVDVDSVPSSCHRWMPDAPLMLPASSWYRRGMKKPNLPALSGPLAADCGGFVATRIWGDYRYTPRQYVDWLDTAPFDWAATMDYCCEDEITTGARGIVRERMDRTTEMAWHFWTEYRAVSWQWVPTIQGWTVENYRLHAREMRPLIERMQTHYGRGWRVGIGTLCRRASAHDIHAVVNAVAAELPGVPLHLWGVKLGAIQSIVGLPSQVVSVDSAAWHGAFGRDMRRWKASGMKKIEHAWRVGYPEYAAKVDQALSQYKQGLLL